jgi:hypothetical protein
MQRAETGVLGMVRAVLGFVVAAVAWMAAFFALTFLIAFVWPAYSVHGRTWFESGVFTFEPPMAALNVACWVLAEVLAGWLAVVIGRRSEVAWALAAALTLYLGVMHLYLEWPSFPWWYNIAVAGLAAPAVLLGGQMANGFVLRPSPAVVV